MAWMKAATGTVLFFLRFVLIILVSLCALGGTVGLIQLVVGLFSPANRPFGDDLVFACIFTGVLLLLSAAFFLLWFWLGRVARRYRPPSNPTEPPISLPCPACGEDDVVRAAGGRARCLSCNGRFHVTRRIWLRLPTANAGDPFETDADRLLLARDTALSPFRAITFLLFMVAAGVASFYAAPFFQRFLAGRNWWLFRWSLWMLFCALAWRLWLWWFPPARRPGRRCVKCAYDLSRCVEPRCPECGTPFDPAIVSQYRSPAGERPRGESDHL